MSQVLINYFVDSLKRSFKGAVWYGSTVNEILDRVHNGNIRYAEKHNLGEILEHMIAWKEYGIKKVQGNESYTIELGGEVDWKSNQTYTQRDLDAYIHAIRTKQTRLIELLKTKNDKWLNEKVPGKAEFDFKMLIEGLLQHDIYHIGQVAMLLPVKK